MGERECAAGGKLARSAVVARPSEMPKVGRPTRLAPDPFGKMASAAGLPLISYQLAEKEGATGQHDPTRRQLRGPICRIAPRRP